VEMWITAHELWVVNGGPWKVDSVRCVVDGGSQVTNSEF